MSEILVPELPDISPQTGEVPEHQFGEFIWPRFGHVRFCIKTSQTAGSKDGNFLTAATGRMLDATA
jgi:hypothetical protein